MLQSSSPIFEIAELTLSPTWTGKYAGLGLANAETCEAAAAHVITLIKDACPALARGGRQP